MLSTRRRGGVSQERATLTVATMPAFRASGRSGHASTIVEWLLGFVFLGLFFTLSASRGQVARG